MQTPFSAWVSLTLTLRGGWTWGLSRWCCRWGRFFCGLLKSCALAVFFALALPFAPIYAVLRVKRLRTWLIPLLLGFVFFGLFALANPVISLAFSAAWRAFLRLCAYVPSFEAILRLLFWVSVGALLWTLLRQRTRETVPPALACERFAPTGLDRLLTPEVICNALIVFNALFAVQTGLDLWYLAREYHPELDPAQSGASGGTLVR